VETLLAVLLVLVVVDLMHTLRGLLQQILVFLGITQAVVEALVMCHKLVLVVLVEVVQEVT
jgi:hypothetical protein